MILIISREDDRSTNDVIDWLRMLNKQFVRVSAEIAIKLESVSIDEYSDIIIELDKKTYSLSQFKSIWYRRSWLRLDNEWFESGLDQDFDNDLNKQLLTEREVFSKYLLSEIGQKSLNKPDDVFINKLTVLKKCLALGILIPKTLITSKKKELVQFKKKHGEVITKNYSQGIFVNFREAYVNSYTILVTDEMIEGLDEQFFPMMFQNTIEKSFELRVFYLDGDFYSSAILSQNDDKTKVDFRNYNLQKPNRTPPFDLPKEQEEKLNQLMKELSLNSGSIDLLVTNMGEYVFLEVNPIGQFAQVSKPCNYHLERRVAEYLISN